AGVMGGLGGAQCRTVAAHAVHNGLTHLAASHGVLHGEKVAYGILVQLRLEEMAQQSPLANTARQQLMQFYDVTGLPKTLADMGLGDVPLSHLQRAAAIACQPSSDIHHLPFSVTPEALMGALVSPTATEMKAKSSTSAAPSAIAVTSQS
ncbi:MAG: iron-containing alcohol dehydrogenase, partial [Cyanobacteria bacterium P01_C01_bin.70]